MRAVSPMCFRAAMSKGGDWIARSSLTTCTTGSTYTTRGPPTASPNAPTSSSPSAQHSVGRRTASRPTHTLLVRRSKPWAWSLKKGRTIAGPALTLQCMPKREGLYGQAEYDEPGRQLHRHVLYPNKPGDVVVVDARGDLSSSIFGEMMLTFFAGRGSVSMVIDVHPGLRPSRGARSRHLGQGCDAEFPCPDQHHIDGKAIRMPDHRHHASNAPSPSAMRLVATTSEMIAAALNATTHQ